MTNETDDGLNGILGLAVEELTNWKQESSKNDFGLPTDMNVQVLAKLMDVSHVEKSLRDSHLPVSQRDAVAFSLSHATVPSRKRFMMLAKFAVAASLLAAFVGAFVFGILGGNTSLYAQVAERLEGLRSLVCRVQIVDENAMVDVDGNNGELLTYLAPSLYHSRDEWLKIIEVYNGETGNYLMLDIGSQEAIVKSGQIADTSTAVSPVRLVEAVRNHFRTNRKDQADVKDLGTRSVDGKQAFGMRSAIGGEIIEAWFDRKSHLPVLVRVQKEIPAELTGGTKEKFWQVMSDFEFDVPVDHTLFSMTVPDGYRLLEKDDPLADTSPATLEDVLKMLRICGKANESLFPLSLSFNEEEGSPLGIQRKLVEQIKSQFNDDDEARQAAVLKAETEFRATVIRGTVFFLEMKDANQFRYFGGARMNDADRPILWYSPDGDNRFKIVYADLTVREANADALPPEPSPVAVVGNEVDEDAIDVSTPTFELPNIAVSDYAQLQAIRKAGKQSKVKYLSLGLMLELTEEQLSFKANSPILPQAVPEEPKQALSWDSNRLAFLSEFTNLSGLDLKGIFLTQRDLESIAKCQSLKQLSLNGVQIVDRELRCFNGGDLEKFAGLSRLESLDLSRSNFAGGLQHLASLTQLHTIFLSSFEHLNDAAIAELAVLPHLETLVLAPDLLTTQQATVTDAGLKSLQQLPALKTLYIGHHGKFTLPVDRLRELLPNVEIKAPLDGVPAP